MSQPGNRWKSGSFDRARLHPVYHPFAPAHAADSLQAIDLDELWAGGKRLLLLDVDNTLVEWKAENFSAPVLAWIERAKGMGFEICIISNTRRVTRLQRLSQLLGVETVRGRFKPSRAMYRLALDKFSRKPHEAIMVGDQMMTDILGANRSGIDAIWVRKMEGPEFKGTRINRFVEGLLTGPIYKSLVTPIDEQPDAPEVEAQKPLADRAIVHQLVKFAIVGGSSFLIDSAVKMTLLYWIPAGQDNLGGEVGRWLIREAPGLFSFAKDPHEASYPFASVVAAGVAMINSFIWNRAWTFQIRGKEERAAQMRRFVVVSLIGSGINIVFGSLFNVLIPGESKRSAMIATVLAAIVAAVWNFLAQRLFAFRQRNA
ncbi:MAG: YqeG family HAD IIIA-type phosphatase [Fimbriimonas sp.]